MFNIISSSFNNTSILSLPLNTLKHLSFFQVQYEDEWSDMQQRFRKEGLDYESLRPEDRLLHVWRWLVDAETNLRNSRRMLDKLHEQQHEEIEVKFNFLR